MDNEKLDLSIDKYNIEDLLGIFGITEPTTKEVIMSLASEAINRYKALQQSKYAEFFSKAMNKLLSSWEDVEQFLENADQYVEEAKAIGSKANTVLSKAAQLAENGEKAAQDFIKKEVPDPGENMLANEYYMDGSLAGRAAENLPNRRSNVSVTTHDAHMTQMRRRLLIPNAYANLPVLQGNMNPNLQNVYLNLINVDSHYRKIRNSVPYPCPKPGQVVAKIVPAGPGVPPGTPGQNQPIVVQDGTSCDFTFTLSEPLVNVISIAVDSMEIPQSWTPFTDEYGTTSFDICHSDASGCLVDCSCVKIPEGFYDPEGIWIAVNEVLGWTALKTLPAVAAGTPAADGWHIEIAAPFLSDLPASAVFSPSTSWPRVPITFKTTIYGPVGRVINFVPDSGCCAGQDGCSCCKGDAGEGTGKACGACKSSKTGHKIDYNLGWLLGFRQPQYIIPNPGGAATIGSITSEAQVDTLGTRYIMLEVEDFNRNRINQNLTTIEHKQTTFKIPSYYTETKNSHQINPDTGLPCLNPEPEIVERKARKGPNNPEDIHVGRDTLTKAQKYTAQQILRERACKNEVRRYLAPTNSNILIRFPVQRLSPNQQVPLIFNNLNANNKRQYFGPVTITRLQVRLLNDKGLCLNLNGMDFSFSLLVEQLYQY